MRAHSKGGRGPTPIAPPEYHHSKHMINLMRKLKLVSGTAWVAATHANHTSVRK